MDKRKIIVYGVLAFIILLTVIYAVSIFSKKGAVAESTDFSIPEMVEKEQAKESYNSRLKNANAYQEPEKKKDIDETVQFKTYDNDKKREVKRNETDYTESSRTVQRRVVRVEPKKIIQEEQKTNEIATVKDEPRKNDSGGFGIVMSKSTATPKKTQTVNVTPNTEGFIQVVLEEDSKIKNLSSVVFFLLEDLTYNGQVFQKNSILFGKAYESGNIFDIQITQISSYADGKVYSVSGLVVYDEKYSRGFAGEGNLNEAVREGAGQTTDQASSDLTSSSRVGIALKAVDNTIKALSRKKEPSINLYKGYKVFIKFEK